MNTDIRRLAVRALGPLLLAALILGACAGGNTSDTGDEEQGAQPAQDGSFASSIFLSLPKPGGALAFDPPAKQNGDWTQSYQITGLDTQAAVQFYDSALGSPWERVSPATTVGDCAAGDADAVGNGCTYNATWQNGPATLEITASPSGTGADDGTGTNENTGTDEGEGTNDDSAGGTELTLTLDDGG